MSRNSINSWNELEKAFLAHYIHNTDREIDVLFASCETKRYGEMLNFLSNKKQPYQNPNVSYKASILVFANSLVLGIQCATEIFKVCSNTIEELNVIIKVEFQVKNQ